MKTFPLRYRAALAAIRAARPAPDYDYRTDVLSVYCLAAPAHRPDLRGKLYLEACEKVPGGITFLNWWAPASPAGLREFFAGLAERPATFVSRRPYRLGQACDGTINDCVLAAFKHASDALGLDADALYRQAYANRDDPPPEWVRCREFADWQGGVALPETWDAAALAGLAESLTEINYHSLRSEFTEATQARLQDPIHGVRLPPQAIPTNPAAHTRLPSGTQPLDAAIKPMLSSPEITLVRATYTLSGEDFRFLPTTNPAVGYFVEPWTNDCLTGPKFTPDQPAPVSLDSTDEAIAAQEETILPLGSQPRA